MRMDLPENLKNVSFLLVFLLVLDLLFLCYIFFNSTIKNNFMSLCMVFTGLHRLLAVGKQKMKHGYFTIVFGLASYWTGDTVAKLGSSCPWVSSV